MRVVALLAAAGAVALLAGCGLSEPQYPSFSDASYRLEGAAASGGGAPPIRTVFYRDGAKMRVETMLPNRGQAAIVFDQTTNAAYVLDAVMPAATVEPAAATPTTPAPAVQASQEPTGVAVRIDDSNAPTPLETAWAALGEENADYVGRCEAGGEQGHEWRPSNADSDVARSACITDDGIVLRITQDGATLWEATSVQRGEQDAALFGVPTGYQIIDPEAVADQVDDNIGELDSVAGEAPAPAPTTP
jgi:hypothetical protein